MVNLGCKYSFWGKIERSSNFVFIFFLNKTNSETINKFFIFISHKIKYIYL